MYNELTQEDIGKLQEEIDHLMHNVRPKCLEDLVTARGFGDLSENYEYKAAKGELRRCDSRLRYLKRMIATAKIIQPQAPSEKIGLYDTVTVYYEDDDEEQDLTITTTIHEDAIHGVISKESPMGRALMNRKVGDRVLVRVSDEISYYVKILKKTSRES